MTESITLFCGCHMQGSQYTVSNSSIQDIAMECACIAMSEIEMSGVQL